MDLFILDPDESSKWFFNYFEMQPCWENLQVLLNPAPSRSYTCAIFTFTTACIAP